MHEVPKDTRPVCEACGYLLETHGLQALRNCKADRDARVRWHAQRLLDDAERRQLEAELGVQP